MRNLKAAALGSAILALLATSPANSADFSPPGTTFTLNGSLVVRLPAPYPPVPTTCTISIVGQTTSPSSNIVPITAVSVTGANICQVVVPQNQPWNLEATSATTVKLNNVKLQIVGTTCNATPLSLVGNWSNVTGFSLTNQVVGACVILQLHAMPSPQVVLL